MSMADQYDDGRYDAKPLMVPYPGAGSGHAGNDTSRERQERLDTSGITSQVQQATMILLSGERSDGLTAADLEDRLGIGHGMASSALSHLHRAGHVRRIKMRRKRHEIYVLPEFVNGREESPYRPRLKPARHVRELPDSTVQAAMDEAHLPLEALPQIRRFLELLP